MITVQSTQKTVEEKIHRHPDILKRKRAFIKEHKMVFRHIFIKEYETTRKKNRAWDNGRMKGRYARKCLWGPIAMNVGAELHKKFGYNPRTNIVDILFHFRRLYAKMYPLEIEY